MQGIHKIVLASLGMGGIVFSLLVGLLVWFESGRRRKQRGIFNRLCIWGGGFPVFLAVSALSALLITWIISGQATFTAGYVKIILYGLPFMIVLGCLGGIIAHFLLKELDSTP